MNGAWYLSGHIPDPSAAPDAKVFCFFSSEKKNLPFLKKRSKQTFMSWCCVSIRAGAALR
jgi:hypothetical protein